MMILFKEKKDCCGCTACMNICPRKAIKMESDEYGYEFPKINNDLCIECELCKKVCAFQNVPVTGNKPISTYVAINKDKDVLSSSASGGIFGALAQLIFKKKGVVFGCAYNEEMKPEHICIKSPLDIKKIQGSKYVQSAVNATFAEAKEFLESGTRVLYTGTPCQIAGLKSYLGKDYNNLITADIICHGVPNANFFKGYIKHLEEKLKGQIIDFKFRDKTKGWGKMGRVKYQRNGKIFEKSINPSTSYYYSYFLKGDIYRENCYECKYTCGSREGDFTMGDYWGIEKAHPEIETKDGVSVLLVNSNKGMDIIDELKEYLNITKSTFEQAREQNGQLNKPTVKSDRREIILNTWLEGGYKAVAEDFYKANMWHIRLSGFKMLIPKPIKKYVKNRLK